jgi:hypothetical protein
MGDGKVQFWSKRFSFFAKTEQNIQFLHNMEQNWYKCAYVNLNLYRQAIARLNKDLECKSHFKIMTNHQSYLDLSKHSD